MVIGGAFYQLPEAPRRVDTLFYVPGLP